MSYAQYLKALGSNDGSEADLSEHDAQLLFGASSMAVCRNWNSARC